MKQLFLTALASLLFLSSFSQVDCLKYKSKVDSLKICMADKSTIFYNGKKCNLVKQGDYVYGNGQIGNYFLVIMPWNETTYKILLPGPGAIVTMQNQKSKYKRTFAPIE